MPTTLRRALAAVLLLHLSGCAAANPTGATTLGSFAGRETSTTGAATGVPAPASSSAPAKGADTSQNAGIGLSTFFDTYNFHFPVPSGQALGTAANSSQKLVASAGGHVYLQVGLQTIDKAPSTQRAPLNVSFVFDHSGSMYGDKIDYTKTAAEHFIDQLGAQDLFSLVAFDSTVDTLLQPGLATDKSAMKVVVEGIQPGSSTNIDGGLSAGYQHVREHYDAGKINRVVLMTDGEANVGEIDPAVLAGRAASQVADGGVSLTTIGVGLEFDGDFLKQLSDAGHGSYYYVNSPDDALKAFADEAQALENTVAKGVKLDIELADGVKLVQVYGHTAKTVGQSLNVDSNDLVTGQSKVVLLELEVPPGTAGSAQDLASVAVDYDDVPYGGHKQATAKASVTYSDDAAAITQGTDGSIASSVIVLQTASVLLRAVDLLQAGQASQAQQELAAQYELVSGKATELKSDDLANEAKDIKQYLDRIGKDSADALAKAMQFDAFQQQAGKKPVVS